eukprot:10637367-Lingulodinium_polyedra.AAC.1
MLQPVAMRLRAQRLPVSGLCTVESSGNYLLTRSSCDTHALVVKRRPEDEQREMPQQAAG